MCSGFKIVYFVLRKHLLECIRLFVYFFFSKYKNCGML